MQKKGFNLLRPQLSPPTAWDKIYQWMVGTARIIVIIVQVIVIVAFGFRIYVDTIGRQLDDEIEQKDAILNSYSNREQEILEAQDKADTYEEIWVQSSNHQRYVRYLNLLIADFDGSLTLNLTKENIAISGSLPEEDIENLEDELKGRVLLPGQQFDPESSRVEFVSVELISLDSESDNDNNSAFRINIRLPEREEYREITNI